jgi:hypothetical protein
MMHHTIVLIIANFARVYLGALLKINLTTRVVGIGFKAWYVQYAAQ